MGLALRHQACEQSAMMRLLTLLLLATLGTSVAARDLTVFAAASLREALDAVGAAYTAQTGDQLVISYAGSSALARQIQLGAPADIFFSANEEWMDVLEKDDLLAPGTRSDLLSNRLVLISRDPGPPLAITPATDLAPLLSGGKLAMALVDSVPAGIYGKAALDHYGLWQALEPSVAQADNVRAALLMVASGAAPLGIVYATDAQAEPRVHVRATFAEDSHPPIRYPVAALKDRPDALPFLDFLTTPEAISLFEANGFTVIVD